MLVEGLGKVEDACRGIGEDWEGLGKPCMDWEMTSMLVEGPGKPCMDWEMTSVLVQGLGKTAGDWGRLMMLVEGLGKAEDACRRSG